MPDGFSLFENPNPGAEGKQPFREGIIYISGMAGIAATGINLDLMYRNRWIQKNPSAIVRSTTIEAEIQFDLRS